MTPVLPFVLSERYDVREEVGRGGHAVVYRAIDRVLDRSVAVKLMREDALSLDLIARFRQEVQVTAQLEHAHILHVYDTGEYDGRPYIVMEFSEGETLAARLARESQLPVSDALTIAREIGLALAHAHANGVVHRDVKPENILLGASGAMLADFGIARVTQENVIRGMTSTGMVVGTVQYMSPEQLCADRTLDGRCDQYAVACVLYEMLAGVRPHVAATVEGLRLLRMTAQHAPVHTHRPSVPTTVDAAIMRALSAMPADRFRTMDEFVGALSNGDTTETAGVAPLSRRDVRLGLGMLLLLCVAAVGIFLWREDSTASATNASANSLSVVVAERSATEGANGLLEKRVRDALASELELWTAIQVITDRPAGTEAIELASSTVVRADSVQVRVDLQRARNSVARVDSMVALQDTSSLHDVVAALTRAALVAAIDSSMRIAHAPGANALMDRSFPALSAYVRAFAALRAGLLNDAWSLFRSAAQASPQFAHAPLWSAQTRHWLNGNRGADWHGDVDRAIRAGGLRGADSLNALALRAMGQMQFVDACDLYRRATTKAPESFVAWYGLAECARLDSVVLRTPAGPRFRSSPWTALNAYRRAIDVAPTAEWLATLYPSMLRTSYAAAGRIRAGRLDDSTRVAFYALPALDADTLAFLPIPEAESVNMGARSVPPTLSQALRRGAVVAVDLTGRWLARFPDSPHAWYERALALELSGQTAAGADPRFADGALDRAANGSRSAALNAMIAVARTRLALRRSDVNVAIRLAKRAVDSAHTSSLANGKNRLAPLAALYGDVEQTIALSEQDNELASQLPPSVGESLHVFRIQASLGACDGLNAAAKRLGTQFDASVADAERASIRTRWLQPAFRDAVPCLGPGILSGYAPIEPLDSAYAALASGEMMRARALLDALMLRRAGLSISSMTWDRLYSESWARAQTGDTLGATAQLLRALEGISGMTLYTLDETAQAAGLRRGSALLRQLLESKRTLTESERAWRSRALQFNRDTPMEKR